MKRYNIFRSRFVIGAVGALIALSGCSRKPAVDIEMSKEERILTNAGNKAYSDSDFISAINDYSRAVSINQLNDIAQFNLTAAQYAQLKKEGMDRKAGVESPARDSIVREISSTYSNIQKQSIYPIIVENAAYNLGNLMYNNEDYQSAIDRYKAALRLNPDNDWARTNLRLAQLKLQNQDQDQDKDNQDQNQDNQDQNQDQQQNQQQNQDQQQQQQNQPQQHQATSQSAEQILKAMENAEGATRAKVNQQEEQQQQSRRTHLKPW